MVMGLSRPADWSTVARLWQGVQEDLGLPAPGIAINGMDGYQLWFSVAEPIPVAQATAFAEALRARYWADIPPARIRTTIGADESGAVPPFAAGEGQWSAFVARDLAPVFSDTPWLDIDPNPDGQADLLTALRSCDAAIVLAVAQQAASGHAATPAEVDRPVRDTTLPPQFVQENDPRQFLLRVMNDAQIDLALRIEAAKALLPHSSSR
ncbi:MAG: hypothetical protein ACOZE7_08195 [Pseudomonadota bacterium]